MTPVLVDTGPPTPLPSKNLRKQAGAARASGCIGRPLSPGPRRSRRQSGQTCSVTTAVDWRVFFWLRSPLKKGTVPISFGSKVAVAAPLHVSGIYPHPARNLRIARTDHRNLSTWQGCNRGEEKEPGDP
jgi:hypothetical protein